MGEGLGSVIPSFCLPCCPKCLAQIITSGVAPNRECSEIVIKFYMTLGVYEVVYSQLASFMKLIFQAFIK